MVNKQKRKIKYSKWQIEELRYFHSSIRKITNIYFLFKTILIISAFIATTIAIGFIVCNRDENIRKLIRPEPVLL